MLPGSQIGPISPERRQELLEASELRERYATPIDRESAHERLTQRVAEKSPPAAGEPVARRLSERGYALEAVGDQPETASMTIYRILSREPAQ